jgi:hypothetical protein
LKHHAIPLEVAQRERDDLARRFVQVERLESEFLPAEKSSQPLDGIGGASSSSARRAGRPHPWRHYFGIDDTFVQSLRVLASAEIAAESSANHRLDPNFAT